MATFLFHSLLILIIEFCAVIISFDERSEENYASPREHGHNIHINFKHPGVLVSIGQLRYAKGQLQLGNEPWKSAFAAMANNSLAAMNYQPNPRAVVECGANSLPNNGCTDERNDALAAYTQALLWFFTDDEQHAEKAIRIMDAWSAQLQAHNNTNALLQAAWSGASFSRAAELIAHTYVNRIDCPKNSSQEGETWPNQPRFKRMATKIDLHLQEK